MHGADWDQVGAEHRYAEAVLVDVCINRGGTLHDPLLAMITGQRVAERVTREGRFFENREILRHERE